jgi:wobble nucleotide-excising tRNase
LVNQINNLQKESKEKDDEINALKEEINNIKLEKSDSMYQVKSILKDFDLYSKYASTNHSNRFNPINNVAGKVNKIELLF